MNQLDAHGLANKLTTVIINPIIALIFAAGLLVFIFGIVEYLWGLSNETEARETGKQHMLWGIIGMFIMVASYTILQMIANSIHAQLPN